MGQTDYGIFHIFFIFLNEGFPKHFNAYPKHFDPKYQINTKDLSAINVKLNH